MHKDPTDDPEESGSRSGSRRSSGPFSRRDSTKKEVEKKVQPVSASTTPKKVAKSHNLDFLVTGKQLLKRSDRANSLPGSYHRRQSADYLLKSKRSLDSPRRIKSREKTRDASLESNMSLDLSQISDIDSPKRNPNDKIPFATSTPKKVYQKANTLPSIVQPGQGKEENLESKENLLSCSRDSVKNSSSTGTYRQGVSTEFDYSSMSPECSGPSSGDSIAGIAQDTLVSPRSQDLQDSSVCLSRCESRDMGEWGHFWANYNNSLARVPISRYYDQCPTPYRSDDIDLTELEFPPETSKIRSPENIKSINNIIRNEGLRLTPRETQNIIKCAHMLGNVLTKAIERQSKEHSTEKIQELKEKPNPEKELKKKAMTLNLRETALPIEVKEEKRWESVPTQTDISLPNTRSAPIIFENILRQLSMSSLDVPDKNESEQNKVDANNVDGN